jgi:hypothetical protein
MPEFIIYQASVDPDPNSDLQVSYVALVNKPAIEKNFQVFNETKQLLKLAIDDDLRIISGPVMVADMPIYRKDTSLGEYYVIFSPSDIQTIVEKFSSKGFLQNFNLFHDDQQQVSDVTIFNSFVSNNTLGITAPDAFKDLPEGSWFITAKVNNDDVWTKIKSGDIKGFSIEGLFKYSPIAKVKMTAEQLYEKINQLINETEIID